MKRLRSEVVSMAAAVAAAKEKESLNKSLSFVKEVKDTFGGETQEYHQFKKLFLDLHDDRISIDGLFTRLSELFDGHNNLIVKFNSLHSKIQPPSSHDTNNNINNDIGNKSSSSNDIGNKSSSSSSSSNNDIGNKSSSSSSNKDIGNKSSSSSNNNIGDYEDGSDESPPKKIKREFSEANKFFKGISKRGECAYRLFLDTMDAYREGDMVASDVYQRVAAVISEKHPDLREELNRYLMDFSEQHDHDHDHVLEQDACCGEKTPPNKIKKEYEDAINFFTRISERLKYDDERAYRLLLDTMAMFGKREVTASGVYSRVALILAKYPDLLEEFKEYFLSEFLEEELRITPSYLILPGSNDDEVIIGGDHQEVLNNVCVLAAPGTWDFSSRPEDRKEYEDLCEDQRLEMDLLLETLISTTEQLKECLAKVNSVCPSVNIKEQLKPRNLRCIKNVYGAHGKDVIDILNQKPKTALPVVLVRLTQKQKELKKFRSDFKYGMSLNVQRPRSEY